MESSRSSFSMLEKRKQSTKQSSSSKSFGEKIVVSDSDDEHSTFSECSDSDFEPRKKRRRRDGSEQVHNSSSTGAQKARSGEKMKKGKTPVKTSFFPLFEKRKNVLVKNNKSTIHLASSNKASVEEIDSDSSISGSSSSDFEPRKKHKRPGGNNKAITSHDSSRSRRILGEDELATGTKEARSAEKKFIEQRKEKSQLLSQFTQSQNENEIVLDFNSALNKKIVIHKRVAANLKPHQIDGIKHMYDCCYGRIDQIVGNPKNEGSGCILAHCMGLGKTLQLIALVHTVVNYPELRTNRILILTPKSTISNWKAEFNKWTGCIRKTKCVRIFEFADSRSNDQQMEKLRIWSRCNEKSDCAACFIMGYEAFRSLIFYGGDVFKKPKTELNAKERTVRELVKQYLLDAADLIVCDEGHMIKSLDSLTNRAVSQIKTTRRIVLTGTPMQNNLMEYHAMVHFVKPSFLGNPKEFRNRYANPIAKGQHKDSSPYDIKLMRLRSFILNRELASFVQRQDVSILLNELPEKCEYVLYIAMSEKQHNLYKHYLDENPYQMNSKKLFADYTAMRKIWTHPKHLELSQNKATKNEKTSSFQAKQNNEDEDEEAEFNDEPTTLATQNWWRQFITDDEMNIISQSPKFEIMFEILRECQSRDDKCLIFSSSVVCLDVVEYFLSQYNKSWKVEREYYRLDGSTNYFKRHKMITDFNKSENKRVKLFLISTKAGGQGINLTAANRIILLDTSWNPSVDQQSIFRIFRFGQKKKCYIYRLLAMGTMEEKIYSRSVTKQAMSYRVVDKKQKDRHYSLSELVELYSLKKPDFSEREIPTKSKDELLDHLMNKFPDKVFKYLEHDSLLDNKFEGEMTEEEKQEALNIHDTYNKSKNEANNVQEIPLDLSAVPSTSESVLNYSQVAQYEDPKNALKKSKLHGFLGKRKLNEQDITWKKQQIVYENLPIEE